MAKKKKRAAKKTAGRGKKNARKTAKAKPRAAAKKKSAKKPVRKTLPSKAAPKKRAVEKAARRPASRASAQAKKSAAGAPMRAGEMYGEENWKTDEEHREGLKGFSEGDNAEEMARRSAEEAQEEGEGPHREQGESDEDSEW